MKVLVFPHHLEIGGSQVNAIDLATACRDTHGHDILFFASPGPAQSLLVAQGFRLVPAPHPRVHPSPGVARALRRTIGAEQPDLVHAWEWPQSIDALYGAELFGVPLMCSEMSMSVLDIVPRHIPLTLGTEQLVATARARRQGVTRLLEPPVDTEQNRPGAVDADEFRARFTIDASMPTVVVVSRLVGWLKQEGIERAMRAVHNLQSTIPSRLIVVGGGTAAAALRVLAESINRDVGREVVTLTGPLLDPRPAYEAADVVVGMGGSSLRAMAFAKPVVVVGERGFSDIFEPATSAQFFWQGYYGLGDDDPSPARLEGQLRALLSDPQRRKELGAYSLKIIEQRYALGPTAATLDELYRLTVEHPTPRATVVRESMRIGTRRVLSAAGGHHVRRFQNRANAPATNGRAG